MRGVNKAILVGTLGKDPEVRHMPNGKAVANFSVATSEQWKDKQTGERKEATEWHRIVCFERLAEIVGEYLVKGSQGYIEGQIKTRKWEKDGVTHYSTEIHAREMQMLGSPQNRSHGQAGQQSAGNPPPQRQAPPPRQQGIAAGRTSEPDPFDDDIPF